MALEIPSGEKAAFSSWSVAQFQLQPVYLGCSASNKCIVVNPLLWLVHDKQEA